MKNEPTGRGTQVGGETAPTMQQEQEKEMCCDGKTTAEEHRRNSPDGKCCIDN